MKCYLVSLNHVSNAGCSSNFMRDHLQIKQLISYARNTNVNSCYLRDSSQPFQACQHVLPPSRSTPLNSGGGHGGGGYGDGDVRAGDGTS